MKIAVMQIGNSQGIRIPESMLEQAHIGDDVDWEVLLSQRGVRLAQL